MGLAECPTEDASKEEKGAPTERFLAEFPDGNVPIRHIYNPTTRLDPPHGLGASALRRRFLAWADTVRHITDRLEPKLAVPVDVLEHAREQYAICYAHVGQRKRHVVTMMSGGLTLRQIARYVDRPLTEIVLALGFTEDPAELGRVHHVLRTAGRAAALASTSLCGQVAERIVDRLAKWSEPPAEGGVCCAGCGVVLLPPKTFSGRAYGRRFCGGRSCERERAAGSEAA